MIATTTPAQKIVLQIRPHERSAKTQTDLMGSDGFADIPTPALDPPHRAASPAVPALNGSRSPITITNQRRLRRSSPRFAETAQKTQGDAA